MAFSTFRGLEASSANSGPPPIVYYSLYPEVSAIPGALGSNEDSYPTESLVLPSSSTYFFTAYRQASTSSNYACMMHNPGAGYVTTGTPSILDSGTSLGGSLTMAAGSVSATGYLVATAITTTGSFNTINVSYMTSSGATITQVASTTYFTGLIGSCAACVLDTTNSLILGDLSGSAQHISLIDSTATTQYATTTTSYSSSSQHKLLGFSTTLGAYVFTNAGGSTLYCAGIDVVSATSLTPHTAVSVSSVGAIYFNAIVLTSTTFLVIYNKSTTQYGLRIVTVGASGSVTPGAEYTYTTGNSATSQIFGSTMLSATTGILNVNIQSQAGGYNQVGVPFSITAGVIAFGLTQYPLSTNSSSSIAKSQLATLSTTQAIYTYDQSVSGIPSPFASTNVGYAGLIDYNNTNPTWGGTFANNNVFNSAGTGPSGYTPIGWAYIGSNRILTSLGNFGTGGYYSCFQLDTNATNIIGATTSASFTTVTTSTAITSGLCRIYNDTSSKTRALGYYYDGSSNVQFNVINVATSGAVTVGSANTSFTNTVDSNNIVVNLAPDTSLYIQGSGATISGTYRVQASIITTSGDTVSAISTLTNIETGGSHAILISNAIAIDANTAAVIYTSDSAGSRCWKIGVVSILGGTPSMVTSDFLTTDTDNLGYSAFTVGTNMGVMVAVRAGAAGVNKIGFSYTSTSVTIGTPATLGTYANYTVSNGTNQMVGVSGTEVLLLTSGGGGTQYLNLLTLAGINSVTTGTQYTSPTNGTNFGYSPMVTTDNQNAVVVGAYGGSGNTALGYIYRG